MTTLNWFRLHPHSGFHFGKQGLDQEASRVTFPSDSLYAALTATAALVDGRAMAAEFTAALSSDNPPVRLTSLFPFCGDLPLFPLPHMQLNIRQGQELERKFTKKVRFVSPAILQKIVRGADMTDDYYRVTREPNGTVTAAGQDGAFMQHKNVWLTWAERKKLPAALQKATDAASLRDKIAAATVWEIQTLSRVRVDRLTNQSQIFRVARTRFQESCGLWLGMQCSDPAWQATILNWLHILGDSGIGAERSSGYGGFRVEQMADPLTFADGGERRLLLSRFVPQSAEITTLQTNAAYSLARVGGWLYAPTAPALRRKTITLIETGSVVTANTLNGRVVNVTPNWQARQLPPVHRVGLALTIPCV